MIHLQSVEKGYILDGQPHTVLRVAELRIAAGGKVALVGASGSGKTTLLNLFSGLVRTDSGQVQVAGHDLHQMSEAACDRLRAEQIGYMFQSFHLLDGFSALENVELGASFAGRAADRGEARTLLEGLELGHRLGHLPSELSVGQQARVALARALVGKPKLILADEPTGALDDSTAGTILDLILERVTQEQATLVVATHDRSLAARFDRVIEVGELNEVAYSGGDAR